MSHCAMRRCSRSCHPVCGSPFANTPRLLLGNPFITSSKCTWAPPPLSKYSRCPRNALSSLLLLPFFFFAAFFTVASPGRDLPAARQVSIESILNSYTRNPNENQFPNGTAVALDAHWLAYF